jgi:DNA polymerase family A
MNIIGIDFETYWSQAYTLSKLTTQEYVQHLDFRAHGASIKVDTAPAFWVGHDALPAYFASVDWSKTAVLAHNCVFDGAILDWVYGVKPVLWIDTLGISRAVLGSAVASHSLDKVAKHLGLAGKVRHGVLTDTKGIRVLTAEQEARMGAYALDDIEDTRRIFDLLRPEFPAKEYAILDWTIRCFVDRALVLDPALCMQAHRDEVARKQAVFDDLAMGDPDKLRAVINSNPQFAKMLGALLTPYGETPPQKISAATGKATWAFGKTDEGFTDLLDHEDERVAALVQARLDTKGALAETRAVKLLECVRYDKDRRIGTAFNYSGAVATHRLSGAGGANYQNMPHGSPLKHALLAPKGHVVIDVDLSQIELRIGALGVGQHDIVEQLRTGGDTYSTFASHVFERPIDKKADPEARQTGKVAVLSCVAKGQSVLTQDGEVPIERVKSTDKLWDGEEWVSHDGVVYQGRKRVIEYAGLRATPDHRVRLASGEWVELGEARRLGAAISLTGTSGEPLWLVDGHGRDSGGEGRHAGLPGAVRLRHGGYGATGQPDGGQVAGVSRVPSSPAHGLESHAAGEPEQAVPRDGATLRQPERSGVHQLRGEGHRVPIRIGAGGDPVDCGEPAELGGWRGRPRGQRRALRAGQPAGGDAHAEREQPPQHRVAHVAGPAGASDELGGVAVLGAAYIPIREGRDDRGADCRSGVAGRVPEAQGLVGHGGEADRAETRPPGGIEVRERADGGAARAEGRRDVRPVEGGARLGHGVEGEPGILAQGERDGARGVDGRGDSSDGQPEDGEDWAHTYDILNAGPRNRFTCQGLLVHNCGYGVGAHAFRKMLRVQAKQNKDIDFCEHVVSMYRSVYPMYPKGWGTLRHLLSQWAKGQMPDPARRLDLPVEIGMHHITLPSGLRLKYPDLDQRQVFDKFKGDHVQAYTFASNARGKSFEGRQKVYAAMLLENLCIAGGTEVLTDAGWAPIEAVTPAQRVWNGEEFAPHGGVVDKATKPVVAVAGVYMTPDHLVRTSVGWERADEASETACVQYGGRAAPQRAADCGQDVWEANCHRVGERRTAKHVAVQVRVWERGCSGGEPSDEGGNAVLRVPLRRVADARYVDAPCVLGMALNEGPLPLTNAPSVEELRREGRNGVHGVDGVHFLLGSHGADVRSGVDTGPNRQRERVLARQLPVGVAPGEQQQQTELALHQHPLGANVGEAGGGQVRDRPYNAAVQAEQGLHGRRDVRVAELRSRVFDILDVEGTNAFLVRDATRRQPLLVHNCQALAAEVIKEKTREIIKYLPAPLQVHDALAMIAPEAEAEQWAAYVREVFNKPVPWWPELPLACELGYAPSYGAIKKT